MSPPLTLRVAREHVLGAQCQHSPDSFRETNHMYADSGSCGIKGDQNPTSELNI